MSEGKTVTQRADTPLRLDPIEFDLVRQLDRLRHRPSSEEIPLLLLLCVSGGMDSMALLHMLTTVRHHRAAPHLGSMELHVLHCNHEQRGVASDGDAAFVEETCRRLAIPCHTELWSQSGPSPSQEKNFQNAARKWRYEMADRLLDSMLSSRGTGQGGWIVTAHHARDHAESLLLHIIRGCGAPGLLGVRPLDEGLRRFRPLVRVGYSILQSYVASRGIAYREDDSNWSDAYDRNFIRNRLLPLIEEKNPAYEEALLRLSDNVGELMSLTERAVGDAPSLAIHRDVTSTEIFIFARKTSPELGELLTRSVLENILHHCRLAHAHRRTGGDGTYRLPLANSWEALVSDRELVFRHNHSSDTL